MILVYTGSGKGKTCACVGQTVRALGQGFDVAFAQFMKRDGQAGEQRMLSRWLGSRFLAGGAGFLRPGADRTPHREAALRVLSEHPCEGRRIAVLGDMLELGEDSMTEHMDVIRRAVATGADLICLVGSEFGKALKEDGHGEIMHFRTSADLAEWLGKHKITGYNVLIKGSRGTKMEKIIEKL